MQDPVPMCISCLRGNCFAASIHCLVNPPHQPLNVVFIKFVKGISGYILEYLCQASNDWQLLKGGLMSALQL